MPVPVQNARASAALQAEFNTVGRLRTSIDETIVAVAVVANLAEQSGATVVRRAAANCQQAAVAGERFVARLELPTGVLGRIRRVFVRNNSANRIMSVFFGSSVAVPANTGTKAFMDGRLRASGQIPAGVLTFDTQVAALATVHTTIYSTLPTNPVWETMDWPFGATNAFDFVEFVNETANELITFSIEWDEFPPVI